MIFLCRVVSVEANSPQPPSPGAAYSPSALAPKAAKEAMRQPQLSPAGQEAIAAGGPSNFACVKQNLDLGVTPPRRKHSGKTPAFNCYLQLVKDFKIIQSVLFTFLILRCVLGINTK